MFNPNGLKMGHININVLSHTCRLKIYVNLDSKARASIELRMFEDQIYIDYSLKHLSNIGLEAYDDDIT